jgi:hypothetical protein
VPAGVIMKQDPPPGTTLDTRVFKGYALNILHRPTGSNLWEVWEDYTHTLIRAGEVWKYSGMTFAVTHARGNEMARNHLPEQ